MKWTEASNVSYGNPAILSTKVDSLWICFLLCTLHEHYSTFITKDVFIEENVTLHHERKTLLYGCIFAIFLVSRLEWFRYLIYIVFPDSAWVDIVRFFYIKEFGQTFSNLTDWLGCKEKCCWHDWEIQAKAWANKGYTVLKLLFIKFAEFVVSNPLKSHFRLWNLMFITT